MCITASFSVRISINAVAHINIVVHTDCYKSRRLEKKIVLETSLVCYITLIIL